MHENTQKYFGEFEDHSKRVVTSHLHTALIVMWQHTLKKHEWRKGSSINDVMLIWIIFDTPHPIVMLFITKALVLLSQNPWHPNPPKAVTSFMDVP